MNLVSFFKETVITDSTFPQIAQFVFGFRATSCTIVVEGAGNIFWSYNGKTLEGRLSSKDVSITFDGIDISKIYMRADNVNNKVRVWAWHVKS